MFAGTAHGLHRLEGDAQPSQGSDHEGPVRQLVLEGRVVLDAGAVRDGLAVAVDDPRQGLGPVEGLASLGEEFHPAAVGDPVLGLGLIPEGLAVGSQPSRRL
jgi:hypothetical protein